MTGLTVSLLLIATILFYRFVEPRHKILLGKILGVILFLIALGIAALLYQDKKKAADERRRLSSVAVTFLRPALASDSIENPFIRHADTITQVSFSLCNNGNRKVTSVTFFPETFFRGHSTPYDLRIPPPYTSNEFHSDFILSPQVCLTLTWRGRFQVFDSVATAPFSVSLESDQ